MSRSEPETETGISFDAATGRPSGDRKRQEKAGPAKRLATRSGSRAPYRAIIEKRGKSTNAT